MSEITGIGLPINHPTTKNDRLRQPSVWNLNRMPENAMEVKNNEILVPRKFSPRRSAIKRITVYRVKFVKLARADSSSLTIATPQDTATTITRIDFLNVLPRELRDKIYDASLPHEILILDGKIDDAIAALLSITHRSRAEILDLVRRNHVLKLSYTSITTLVTSLDAMPANFLAAFNSLTITSSGPYNCHASVYGTHRFHRCNVCPTLQLRGDRVWFEVDFACNNCDRSVFYWREIEYACHTLQLKVERVTGKNLSNQLLDVIPTAGNKDQFGGPVRGRQYQSNVSTIQLKEVWTAL